MSTDELLAAGTLLAAPLPPTCAECHATLADGTDDLCALCRPDQDESIVESARAIGGWIPACDIIPEPLVEVVVTDGVHWFQGFIGFDGRWWMNAKARLPDDFVTHWCAVPALPSSTSSPLP